MLWVSECIQWLVFALLQLISLNFLLLFINHLFVHLQLFVATAASARNCSVHTMSEGVGGGREICKQCHGASCLFCGIIIPGL